LIVVLSPAAIASNNVLDEVSFALDEGKIVVPILLQDCTIPFRLRRLQYVDFTRDYEPALAQLLRNLALADSTAEQPRKPAAAQDSERPSTPIDEPPVTASAQGSQPPAQPVGERKNLVWIVGGAAALLLLAILANGLLSREPQVDSPDSTLASTDASVDMAPTTPAITTSGCENLEFDVATGTLNGLKPTASQEDVIAALPCSTGSTPEGSDSNYGGGVFFLDHDFFFYTARDFIEIREKFSGRVSLPLLGADQKTVVSRMGSPQRSLAEDRIWLFSRSYGCLRLQFNASKVTQIDSHEESCQQVEAQMAADGDIQPVLDAIDELKSAINS
jgi:hypothetical protein